MKNLIIFLLLLTSIGFAGIGENFEPAGISLGGSARFAVPEFQLGEGGFDIEDRMDFDVRFSVGLMTVRNLEVDFSVSYNYNSHIDWDWHSISFGSGLAYYFVNNPDLSKGVVHSLGTGAYFYVGFDGESSSRSLLVPLNYSANFFVTDRIAPALGVSFPFMFHLQENFYVSMQPAISFNLRFFFPRKMRVTHPIN